MAAGMGCCQMTGSPFRAAEGINPWVTTAVRLSIVREERGSWEFERAPIFSTSECLLSRVRLARSLSGLQSLELSPVLGQLPPT